MNDAANAQLAAILPDLVLEDLRRRWPAWRIHHGQHAFVASSASHGSRRYVSAKTGHELEQELARHSSPRTA